MNVSPVLLDAVGPEPVRGGRVPGVTVAICTHGRPEQLRRALESLKTMASTPDEILVVDNAPPDGSTERVMREKFPGVRYVCETVPGLDFARNRALRDAAQPIVAFLDDDAVVDPLWLDGIRAVFADDPGVGLCTGRVEAYTLEAPAQRLFEANGGYSRGEQRIRLPRDTDKLLHGFRAPLIAWAVSVGSGCSMAVRRDLALRIGGFDEALDMGRALPGGGDHDMMWRVLQGGYDLVYDPRIVAMHEHRTDPREVRDQLVGHQRALVALLTKVIATSRGRRRWEAAAFLGWRLLKPGIRLLRRVTGRDPLPVSVLLRMWGHAWLGMLAYPRAMREAERRKRIAAARPDDRAAIV
jgi:GT2 family glycosyltransferase